MKNNVFIKVGLCFIMLTLAFSMWIVGSSSLASISGVYGLMFLITVIFEYKNIKFSIIGLNITMFGLGFILLLQIFLSWNYSPLLSYICGLSGITFLLTASYEYKIKKAMA